MNIAFVTRSERNPLNALYLQHVVKASAELVEAGHQVMVVMDKGELLKDTNFSTEVELIEIEFQNSPWRSRYLSEAQAVSDQFLLAVSAINTNAQLDVIEFPLWGGLGFSTIRCKRLLGYCKPTKIVTNVIFAHSLLENLDDTFFPSVESEAIAEMETYVLRYSDLVCSPLEAVGEKLKKQLGRSDIRYYDPLPISAQLADSDPSDRAVNVLKTLASEGENQYAPLSVEEIFNESGRKIFSKKDTSARIAILVPFQADNPESSLGNLAQMRDETLEVVYYCDSEEEEVQEAFMRFEATTGRKYDTKLGYITAFDVFRTCKSGYLMIFNGVFDVNEVYLKTAISSLINNPELAYVGAYLGGVQYPLAYLPTLMPVINTCALFGNVFRKRSLMSCLEGSDITLSPTAEWDILDAIHQRYLSGDILPHTFCRLTAEVNDPAFAATSRLRESMQKQKSWAAKSTRLLKLLVSSPELLVAKGPQMDTAQDDWEFTVPVCRKLSEEAAVVEIPVEPEAVEVLAPKEAIEETGEPEVAAEAALAEVEAEEAADTLPEQDIAPEEDDVEEIEESEEEAETEEPPLTLDEDSEPEVIDIDSDEIETDGETEISEPEVKFEAVLDEEIGEIESNEDTDEADVVEEDEIEEDQPEEEAVESEMDRLVLEDEEVPEDQEEVVELLEDEEPIQLPSDEIDTQSDILEEEVEQEDDTEQEDTIPEPEPVVEQAAVDVEDDGLDWFQVFWAKDSQFVEKDSITEPYQEGAHLYLEFAINAAQEVNTIRLDPCNRVGVISIRKIEVRDNESGLIVFSASEDNAFDNIVPSGDFEVSGIEQDALILKSTGNDPQLIIYVKHTIIKNFTLTMKYDYKRSS